MGIVISAVFLVKLSCGVKEGSIVPGVMLLQMLLEFYGIGVLEQDRGQQRCEKAIGKVHPVDAGLM